MSSLCGGGGMGGFWCRDFFGDSNLQRKRNSKPSDYVDGTSKAGHWFPLRQAATAGCLVLTGDTIAQVSQRWRKRKDPNQKCSDDEPERGALWTLLLGHDWLRALRMTSYGFLLYGPGSYAWYRYLDQHLSKQTVKNLMIKVLLNQIVLGPSVIAVVFAWNNLWQGKICELPAKYKKDALPTLLYGFRFWIPVSILNFWVIPLQARVAFMSVGSIFWNFILSSRMSK